jgi:hypothetical protein
MAASLGGADYTRIVGACNGSTGYGSRCRLDKLAAG